MPRLSLLLTIPFFAFANLASCAYAQAPAWSLHAGDRVVFYGDSITEQRFYTWWTELFAVTRFPAQHVLFWNAGVGGDRVTGGSGGSVDVRLARDVFAHKPTVVTVMLGMNDGNYTVLTPSIEQMYVQGYEHILQSLQEHTPDARVLAIGPSAYDDVTRPQSFAGGYNRTLVAFGVDDKALAAKYHGGFVDANAPLVAALARASASDNLAAQLLVPDRVHPEISAHLVIAMALLDGWHAPALVSATKLDAVSGDFAGSDGAGISGVERSEVELRWTAIESALPMPMGYGHAGYALVKEVTGFTQRFNLETLAVQHLQPGSWTLRIDDVDVGTFDAGALAQGINLAEMDTPMRRQSQNVEWTIRDKGDLQFVRTRIQIHSSPPETASRLDQAEAEMQQRVWRDAAPVAHRFRLRAVGSAEISGVKGAAK